MRKLISVIISIAIIGIPLTFIISYLNTRDLKNALINSFEIFAIIVASALLLGFLEYLGKNIVQQISEALVNRIDRLIAGHKKVYIDYIIIRHRFFDTKGLTVQGEYYLELDKVYVELDLKVQESFSEEFTDNIWGFLSANREKNRGSHYAILGLPGSGKTTLLRHMVLTLAGSGTHPENSSIPKKLPIFLTLREHAPQIQKANGFSLCDAIIDTLAGKAKEVPSEWFEDQLRKGQCIVLMDGLDEIADEKARLGVVNWVEKQMAAYPKNDFIVASRPHGYHLNPIDGVNRLEIKPFTNIQVREFITRWYLANEIKASQRDDLGVTIVAEENAERLIRRLQVKSELAALAVNPLLVTMIATVHHYKAVLPGRRVELYAEIFDVFLEKRRHLIWESNRLGKSQKMEVLCALAYHMMTIGLRTISLNEATRAISKELIAVGSDQNGEDFLRNIEHQSGLILDVGDGNYQFAHLTYQEFLTAKYIFDQRTALESVLIKNIDGGWWDETIRLYVAMTDATNIIQACLEKYPDVHAYSLALDCIAEALKVDPGLRLNVEQTLAKSMNSEDMELRSLTAEAMLTSRVAFMTRITNELMIDRTLIFSVEYQLFLDEMQSKGYRFFPDHWKQPRFPEEEGAKPIVGIRFQDAQRFCKWLTEREKGSAKYRLPTSEEANSGNATNFL